MGKHMTGIHYPLFGAKPLPEAITIIYQLAPEEQKLESKYNYRNCINAFQNGVCITIAILIRSHFVKRIKQIICQNNPFNEVSILPQGWALNSQYIQYMMTSWHAFST